MCFSKGLLVVLAALYLAAAAFALDPTKSISQYVHDKWGPDRGFVGGRIYAICQSSDGVLWIGAEKGLVRFDGFNFTLIQKPFADSPELGPVRGLALDGDGTLWIRLEGPRMISYRDGKFTDEYARFDFEDVTFSALAVDNDGNVVFSALGDRFLRHRQGRLEDVFGPDESIDTVLSMTVGLDKSLWLGTRDTGLFRESGGKVTRIATEPDNASINALLPGVRGGLWVGSDRGLQYWDGSALIPIRLPSNDGKTATLSLSRDRDANVWVGTDQGLMRIVPPSVTVSERSDVDAANEVTAVYEDRNADIWFGDSDGLSGSATECLLPMASHRDCRQRPMARSMWIRQGAPGSRRCRVGSTG